MPLKGLRPYQALIGPTQASGLAGGFDLADCLIFLSYRVLHGFDIRTDAARGILPVLFQQLDDGRADDHAIGELCHPLGLFRRGDSKADGGWDMGVLPHSPIMEARSVLISLLAPVTPREDTT